MTGKALTPTEQKEWHAAVILALPHDIDPDKVRAYKKDRKLLLAALRCGLMPVAQSKEPIVPVPAPAETLFEETDSPKELSAFDDFDAARDFQMGGDNDLPIHSLGESFEANFFGIADEHVPAITVRQRKLLKPFSLAVLTALGETDPTCIEKSCMPLAQVRAFLKTADQMRWYLFFVPDVKGTVRLLRVHMARGEGDRCGWTFKSKDHDVPKLAYFRGGQGDYIVSP